MNPLSIRRLLPVLLLLPAAAFAQDAQAILTKVAENYQSMKNFHFEGASVSETKAKGVDTKSETEFIVAYTEPDKFRLELRYPTAGNWVRLSDGKNLYDFRSTSKDRKKEEYDPSDIRILKGSPVSAYEFIDRVNSAKIIGSESVSVEGKDIDCHVIEVERAGQTVLPGMKALPTRYWVDKARLIVLRQVGGSQSEDPASLNATENTRTITITVAKVNEPVPETLFALNPGK
jgi:outer membrane lipoprotein-sorting protein